MKIQVSEKGGFIAFFKPLPVLSESTFDWIYISRQIYT